MAHEAKKADLLEDLDPCRIFYKTVRGLFERK